MSSTDVWETADKTYIASSRSIRTYCSVASGRFYLSITIAQLFLSQADWVTMNYVPFGEKALTMVVNLYQKTASEPVVIDGEILRHVIEALRVPLSMKYACPSATTWKLAVTSLLAVLHTGLPLARTYPEKFQNMWPVLADTMDDFLFPKRWDTTFYTLCFESL